MTLTNPRIWGEGEVLWSIYPLESFMWPSIHFSCSSKLYEAGIPPHGMNIEYDGVIKGDSGPVLVQYRGGWVVRPLNLAKNAYKFNLDEKEVTPVLKGVEKEGNGGFRTEVLDEESQEMCDMDVEVNGKVPDVLKTAISIAFLLTSTLEIRECMRERGLRDQDVYWTTAVSGIAADQTVEEFMKFLSDISNATKRARILKSTTLPRPPQRKRVNVAHHPGRKRIRKEPTPNLDDSCIVRGSIPRDQHSKRPSSEETRTGAVSTTTNDIKADSLATRPLTLSEMLAMKRLQVGSGVLEVRHDALAGNGVLMMDLLGDGVAALNGEKDADLDRLLVCSGACYYPPLSPLLHSCR